MNNLDNILDAFAEPTLLGQVKSFDGGKLEVELSGCKIGSIVEIDRAKAIVTGFNENLVTLSLLDHCPTLGPNSNVKFIAEHAQITLSDKTLGKVLDPLGNVLNQDHFFHCTNSSVHPLEARDLSTLERSTSHKPVRTGVKAIDLFTPLASGQRIAVFAEPGVGKSTLTSMIARHSDADVRVIALIGERGREAAEFIEKFKKTDAQENTVFVVSTSADTALKRSLAADTAMCVAEYFAKKGLSVLLQLDSLSRLFRAYREVGLSNGETSIRKGYPPSAFAKLPRLLERAGNFKDGSITAMFTVLLSGDIDEDPLVEEAKGLLDGHIYLRSTLTKKGVYPAFDIENSLSRMADKVTSKEQFSLAAQLKRACFLATKNEDALIFGGECSPDVREALTTREKVEKFICQHPEERAHFDEIMREALLIDNT